MFRFILNDLDADSVRLSALCVGYGVTAFRAKKISLEPKYDVGAYGVGWTQQYRGCMDQVHVAPVRVHATPY